MGYSKACDCKNATATAGEFRFQELKEHSTFIRKVTFYEQPSCDVCGKHWVEEIKAE